MLWRGRGVPGLFGYQPLAVRRADDLSILRGPVAQYAFSGPALSPALQPY